MMMSKMPDISALLVEIETPSGELVEVGLLYNSAAGEKNWFEFSDRYWNRANRPVLGQIFEERGRSWQPTAHVALPHWFSHLLPEGRLRGEVAAAAHTNSAREFNLLARIGLDDLPGALRVGSAPELANIKQPPELIDAEKEGGNPLLKFSLAGAQLKFSIYKRGSRLTVPLKGQAGNVIAKLPDNRPGHVGVPEVELASLNLARLSGIETPDASLVSLSEIAGLEDWARKVSAPALVVDRFDRAGERRIHMEELAQVMNIPTKVERAKYDRANFETIANIIAGLCGIDSVKHVITRIVFNVLIGNGDAHLKNWAVLYKDGFTPTLSPVYDILPTVLYMEDDDLGSNLGGSRSFETVSVESFDRIGERTSVGVAAARSYAKDAVEQILSNWQSLSDMMPRSSFNFLNERLNRLRIVRSIP
jgi:serine/threonine-protein kinase HipA